MKVLALLLLAATAVLAKHEAYQGWRSYYIGPAPAEKLKIFNSIYEDYGVDVLSRPLVNREGVILVKPEQHDKFIQILDELQISYKIHRDDVKKALDYDDEIIQQTRMETLARNGGRAFPYDNYQPLDVIYDYVDDIAARFPDTVTLVEPAKSFEGRPLKYLKISTTNFEDESKPIIFIDGGIHAREWITPPAVTWAIHKLTENVTEPDLLERFDWILMPVVNPDGYDFTFTPNGRWWRKTRSTDQHPLSALFPGVDGNRNFDFFWNTVGTSNSPAADNYAGSAPFSEIECRVIRDALHENLHRIALYITMHSYGSMILYGWGHDGTLSNNALGLHSVGVNMANAIDRLKLPHFPNYVVGNSALTLNYAAAGAAEDYAHYIGVPLAYTFELPGLADGLQGFNLNPRYIEQVSQETWAGVVVGARMAGDLF
ncbi:zinc carboxypeptidase domain-containing protein [Phthorimaea operculella]|nr:zinc carboxypeptidase domain-containing protein [Phthorimaea operculella]